MSSKIQKHITTANAQNRNIETRIKFMQSRYANDVRDGDNGKYIQMGNVVVGKDLKITFAKDEFLIPRNDDVNS